MKTLNGATYNNHHKHCQQQDIHHSCKEQSHIRRVSHLDGLQKLCTIFMLDKLYNDVNYFLIMEIISGLKGYLLLDVKFKSM